MALPAVDVRVLYGVPSYDPEFESRRAAVYAVPDYVPSRYRLRSVPTPQQFAPDMVVTVPAALRGAVNPSAVRYVQLDGIADGGVRGALMGALNACVNIEVLLCRGSSLTKIGGLALPRALVIDLAANALDNAKHVAAMVAASPELQARAIVCACNMSARWLVDACPCYLLGFGRPREYTNGAAQVLDLTGNKVALTWTLSNAGVPPPKSPLWEWLHAAPHLRLLNRAALSGHGCAGTIVAARGKKAPPVAAAWALRAYDDVMDSRVAPAAAWAPETLTCLAVPSCALTVLHLGGLRSLTSLDARGNRLTTLRGSGAHTCAALASLNLSGNAFVDLLELDYFGHLPALRELAMSGNPVAGQKKYRATVLWATRGAGGVGFGRGLADLDGTPVAFAEVAATARACGGAAGVWLRGI